jgi:hypothetical protein
MIVKQYVHIEVEKDGKLFTFSMPIGVQLGMAYDAAFECLSQIVELANQAKDRAEPEKKIESDDACVKEA